MEAATPPMPATSRVPSAEEATEFQALTGALVTDHVVPESVEMEICPPSGKPLTPLPATSVVPSAADASEIGQPKFCIVFVQVAPESVEV